MASYLFFLAVLCLPFIVKGQERAPHGLVYESPIAFSPDAYSFFHPETRQKKNSTTESLCDNNTSESGCSELPTASSVQSNLAHQSLSPPEDGERRIGAGGIVGILLGFVFATIVLAFGVYYVVITRKSNSSKANPVQLINV